MFQVLNSCLQSFGVQVGALATLGSRSLVLYGLMERDNVGAKSACDYRVSRQEHLSGLFQELPYPRRLLLRLSGLFRTRHALPAGAQEFFIFIAERLSDSSPDRLGAVAISFEHIKDVLRRDVHPSSEPRLKPSTALCPLPLQSSPKVVIYAHFAILINLIRNKIINAIKFILTSSSVRLKSSNR